MKEPQVVFTEYLSHKKLKMTPQRKLIVDAFLAATGHLASEELYGLVKRRDRSIGQATVYRTLKLLSDSGLAKGVHFGDGVTRYERQYGASHHDHLICEECGKNLEVMDERIEALQENLARAYGFELTSHKMYLYGLCGSCQKEGGIGREAVSARGAERERRAP